METKKSIRKMIAARRKASTEEERALANEKITASVLEMPEFQQASCIYIYIAYNREVETRAIIEAAWKAGKQVAVPRVEGKEMTFYLLESFDQLSPGCFGIPEPVEGLAPAACEEALMIMPGVAFDSCCCRVGYGGGFYDRYLEQHSDHPKVALAFSFQMIPEAPTEPTDIFPDKLITEEKIYIRNVSYANKGI